MKKIITILVSVLIFTGVKSQNIENIFDGWKEVYFSFQSDDKEELDKLSSIISLDEVKANTIYAYANENEFLSFLKMGKAFTILPHPSTLIKNHTMRSAINIKEVTDWDFYPTYEAYLDIMNQFQTNHPDICQVYSIGQSVQGRELMVAHISDNPASTEAEPQVFYTSTMHGDETTGYVLALHLIDYLLTNYGTDPRVTGLVNNLDIYINPLANPDGTYAGGNSTVNNATRYNANSVDLNRNFPDPVGGEHPDGNEWQPETIVMMDFAEEHNFVISSNWHGGAEVYNYPWDDKYELAADTDWWEYTGHSWADTVHLHSNSGYFTDLNNGVTNGAAWYSIQGGRQDYMNYYQHCREFTLELSASKMPPAGEMPYFWETQYRSMLNYFEEANYGIQGTVLDNAGNPVKAKIFINDHDEDQSWVYSSEENGDFYRPIKAGTYSLTVSSPCFDEQTFDNVVVQDGQATQLNVVLTGGSFNADFEASSTFVQTGGTVEFTSMICGNPTSYAWTFEGGTPSTSTEENPIITYDTEGTFSVSLTISDGTNSSTKTKEDYITVSTIYNMENGTFTTCNGLFYDAGGENGNYSNNQDITMTFLPETPGAMMQVSFLEFEIEENATCLYDYLSIYDGTSSSSTLVGTYCGTNSPGTVTATNPDGALTFYFHSDISINQSGWQASIHCVETSPIADFSADDTTIIPGGTVQFSDLSANNPTSWAWTFTGGTPATSTEENPVVTYANSGNYSVSLTATNDNGSNTMTKTNFINVDSANDLKEFTSTNPLIYPNPTSGKVKIKLQDDIVYLWEVLDFNGKIILQQKGNHDNMLDMSKLNRGTYFVRAYASKRMYINRVRLVK